MGGRQSKQKNLLEGTAWLRTVVTHHQRTIKQTVSRFESFTVEPVAVMLRRSSCNPSAEFVVNDKKCNLYDDDAVALGRSDDATKSLRATTLMTLTTFSSGLPNESNDASNNRVMCFRVCVKFRTNKNKPQMVNWIVKTANVDGIANQSLFREITIYKGILSELNKFLSCIQRSSPRAKFLLNVPSMIYSESVSDGNNRVPYHLATKSAVRRCYLVLEDIVMTKGCQTLPVFRLLTGLTVGQFKVFLSTLAQFHAVGVAWNRANEDDSALDNFPVLHVPSPKPKEYEPYLDMYEMFLLWYFSGNRKARELQLFKELRMRSEALLSVNLIEDMCNPLGGLCVGNLLPSEIMFQFTASGVDKELRSSVDVDNGSSPVCAAITSVHRVHFGHLVRELATLFYLLPMPLVRSNYMIFMLQNYCHVLTLTSEMLEFDWHESFGNISFQEFLETFFNFIPHGIMRAIICHMKQTEPQHLHHLITSCQHPGACTIRTGSSCNHFHWKGNTPSEINMMTSSGGYIPLTEERIDFLVKLLEPVHKNV